MSGTMALLPMHKFKKSGQSHRHLLHPEKCSRFLITITVLGSTGPIRFIVKEEDLVASVIETALRSYARQGRYPALGSDFNSFLLYCANGAGSEALSPVMPIGSSCCRNFVLCKKQTAENESSGGVAAAPPRRIGDSWKAWLNRSFKLNVAAH